MEIWILLVAAGSGYLTHCWKKFQKSKEMSSDIRDDNDGDTCRFSKILILSQTRLDAVDSYPASPTNSMNSSPRCPALPALDACCALNCCSFAFSDQNCQGCALISAEDFLDNWHSGQCVGDSTTDSCGSMLQDECPINLLHEALDDGMASEERASPYDDTWSFWTVSDHASVLETSSSSIMQEHGGRSSTNARKVRSHRKNGKRRCFARISKNLETCWSSTSSESCFPLQFDDMCNQENVFDNTHLSSACLQPFNGLESVEAVVSHSLLSKENHGLRLSPSDGIFKVLNKDRKPDSLVGEKGAYLPRLFLQSRRRRQVKSSRECSASQCGDSLPLQGTANDTLKAFLFHFGVGVGMMFANLSNKHGTKQSIEPLEETLCALKVLEGDVHGRTELMAQCYQTKGTREDATAEQINALFKVVSRIFDVVDRVRNSLSQDLACISAMDFKNSKARARLEAELEAELERMEMNLSTGDVNELCRRQSGASEDDLKCGNSIQGELSARGLPCDTESSKDCADSAYEVFHYGNFSLPPLELARRLHEVLEARQEREISELKAEVKYLNSRLQAKHEELQVWKQTVLHLLQGNLSEKFSSHQEAGVCVKARGTMENLRRGEELCHFSVGMHDSALDSSLGCNGHISSDCMNGVCSFHSRVQQPKTCLIDEADDEVSEQIFLRMSDTDMVSPRSSPDGILCAEDNGKRGTSVSHQELESTDFSNEATDDTSDNSPCSVKFVDKHTNLNDNFEDRLKQKEAMEASSRKKHSNLDWSGEVEPLSKAKSFTEVSTDAEICDSYEQFRHALDWSTSEDGSYSSDVDERSGQLLIKRIVEKSKRGSSIIEVAQSVAASLDVDGIGVT